MGVEYSLVNKTKKEIINYFHLTGSKKRELAGNPVQSSITTWYLLNNQGDEIQFISDTYGEWPFSTGSNEELIDYVDKTEDVIKELIFNNILKDNGFLFIDEDEPEVVYVKEYVNIWFEN